MRRRRSVFRTDPNADPMINTTPLIDVMLVILVMFIITIPPPTHSVDVTLPKDALIPAPVRDENHITIDTADIIRWNDEAVDLAELGLLVKAASERAEPATLDVRACGAGALSAGRRSDRCNPPQWRHADRLSGHPSIWRADLSLARIGSHRQSAGD